MFTETTTFLTDKDRILQLKAIMRKLRKLYDPTRWSDPETFERGFETEYLTTYSAIARLKEGFMFTMRVGRGPKMILRRRARKGRAVARPSAVSRASLRNPHS